MSIDDYDLCIWLTWIFGIFRMLKGTLGYRSMIDYVYLHLSTFIFHMISDDV